MRHRFHCLDGLAGAVSGRGVSVDFCSGKAVEMGQKIRPGHPAGGNNSREGNHQLLIRSRIEPGEIFRLLPECRLGLENDPPHPAVLIELAGRKGAELSLDGTVHILDRHTEQSGFLTIHLGAKLLGRSPERGIEAAELRSLPGFFQKILGDFIQSGGITRPRILEPELEASGSANPRYGRRCYRNDQSLQNVSGFPVKVLKHCP